MGLTVYYDFRLPLTVAAGDVQALLGRWREFAVGLRAGRVTPVHRVARQDIFCSGAIKMPDRGDGFTRMLDVPVEQGWMFFLSPGEGSEPLRLALCRYPEWIEVGGRRRPTRLGGAWCLHGFCKTQYASVHGWEAFLAAHRMVIDCLAHGRALGVRVRIRDEGGYWPRRSVPTLRRKLDEMNGLVAAVAGAFKDATEEAGGGKLTAPIFAHPQFERLELAGERHAARVTELVRQVVRDRKQP